MSEGQESRSTTNNQPGYEGPDDLGYITRSIIAKAQWVQRMMSPWARRWLQRASPETGGETPFNRYAQTALTATSTNLLLDRVQRVVDRGTVWRPDVGSLQPVMVDHFTSAIVERFPDISARYESRPLDVRSAEATDLILAGGPVGESLEVEEWPAEPEETESAGPPSRLTMAEMRAMWEAKQGHPAKPLPTRSRTPPQVQRVVAEPSGTRPPARPLPEKARLFSRVEELSPRIEIPGDQSPEVQLAQVKADQAEQAQVVEAAMAAVEETQPEPRAVPKPPAVQRQPEEEAAPPVAEPKPPPPPVVQQQPEEETASPVAEAEPPGPPVIRRKVEPKRPQTPPVMQRQPEEEVVPPVAEAEPPSPPVVRRKVKPERPKSPPVVQLPPAAEEAAPPVAEAEPPGPLVVRQKVAPERPQAPPVVQRQPEEEAAPIAEAEPPGPLVVRQKVEAERPKAPPAAEAEPPGPLVVRRKAEPEQPQAPPVVQQLEEEAPPEPVQPAEPLPVQRQIEPEPTARLEEEVLARAESKARLPLAEPRLSVSGLEPEPGRLETAKEVALPEHRPLPMTQIGPPAQTTILPQARFEKPPSVRPARPQALRSELPLPPVSRAAPVGLIQRQPATPSVDLAVAPQSVEIVQRAVAPPLAREEKPGSDPDQLARQIYPLIKRMLAVERERRIGRRR